MKLFNEPYKDGLCELVGGYYKWLPSIMDYIIKFQSVRSIIDGCYQVLVNHKELDEIKTLPEKEKARIYKMTEGLEKPERIKASRAIYLMEKVLTLQPIH